MKSLLKKVFTIEHGFINGRVCFVGEEGLFFKKKRCVLVSVVNGTNTKRFTFNVSKLKNNDELKIGDNIVSFEFETTLFNNFRSSNFFRDSYVLNINKINENTMKVHRYECLLCTDNEN